MGVDDFVACVGNKTFLIKLENNERQECITLTSSISLIWEFDARVAPKHQ